MAHHTMAQWLEAFLANLREHPGRNRRFIQPPGPNARGCGPRGTQRVLDYPRRPRPAGGFTRPMWTCPTCWCTSPAFHVRVQHRCIACGVPVAPPPLEIAS